MQEQKGNLTIHGTGHRIETDGTDYILSLESEYGTVNFGFTSFVQEPWGFKFYFGNGIVASIDTSDIDNILGSLKAMEVPAGPE